MDEIENQTQGNEIIVSPEEILWKLTEQEQFIKFKDLFKAKVKENNKLLKPGTELLSEDCYNSSIAPLLNEGINKEEFILLVQEILDIPGEYEAVILELFNQIDINAARKITWDNFLDYNLKALEPKTGKILEFGEVEYVQPKQIKRDPIVKFVLLETDEYFSYAMVTKYGKISLYDSSMKYLLSYIAITSREDQFTNTREARKRYRWITDAVFMNDINIFVIVNSTRNMVFYDASSLKHEAIWLICSFPDIIQSIAYVPEIKNQQLDKDPKINLKKTLILGMNTGEITLMSFLKPKDGLLKRKSQDKLSVFYYLEMNNYLEYVNFLSWGQIHNDSIISLQVLEDQRTIVSCSRDPKISLIVRDIENSSTSFAISSKRGINCFAISLKYKIIITGSDNGNVQIWNYHKSLPNTQIQNEKKVSTKKNRKLTISHKENKSLETISCSQSGIIDIVVLEGLQIFFCCSRTAELKFYDLKEFKNMQIIQLQFECFNIGTIFTPVWSNKCIFPGPKRKNMKQLWERNFLLVTCCNAYAKIVLYYMDGLERHLHTDFLPPQPLQNSVLIPNDWEYRKEIIHFKEENLSSLDKEHDGNLDDTWDLKHEGLLNINLDYMEKSNIHSKIALLEERKAKMKWAVEHCAPFLALDLYEIKEIELPITLPSVDNKKTKSVVEKTRRLLADTYAKSITFSDLSSSSKSSKSSKSSSQSSPSTSGSSRSSIYEFE